MIFYGNISQSQPLRKIPAPPKCKSNKVKNEKSSHYMMWEDTEVIDIIKNQLTEEEYKGFLKGNILKYRLRAGKKNIEQDAIIKDIEKANDYETELMELI